jgi:hypothetical protein
MERSSRGTGVGNGRPVIVCGAGNAAHSLIRDMRGNAALACGSGRPRMMMSWR